MNIVVFVTGMVGSAIAKDLNQEQDIDISAIDVNHSSLDKFAGETKINFFSSRLTEG